MRSFACAASLFIIAGSLVACAEPDTTDDGQTTDPPFAAMTSGNGSSGSNHLSEVDFRNLRMYLAKAARLHALVEPGTKNLSSGVQTLLGNSAAAVEVIKYAIACTVPESTEINGYGQTFKGRGHLTTGAAWMTGPLSHSAINDLMACMIVHVNAYGATVPIQLFGANVQNDALANPDFMISEARWVATVNVDDVPSFYVWPSGYTQRACIDTLSALVDRLCGQWPNGCNLQLGSGSCTYDNVAGGYFCGTIPAPAIETKLRPADFADLYDPKACDGIN